MMPSPTTELLVDAWRFVALHLWQSTLVVVPALVAARLARRAPARVVHGLYVVAVAKLLLPVAVVGGLTSRIADRVLGSARPLEPSPVLTTIETVHAVLEPIPALGRLTPLVAFALGAAALAWLALTARRATSLARHAIGDARSPRIPLERAPQALADRLRAGARRTGVPVGALRIGEDSSATRVTGPLRPEIVLAPRLVAALSDEELDAVLLHEDAHRKRYDPARNVLVELAAAALAPYPLLGPVVRGFRRSTELVCDALAIAHGARPRALASALALDVLHALPADDTHRTALGGPSPLRERLARIQEPRRYHGMRSHRVALGALTAVAVAVSFAPIPFMVGCTTPDEAGAEATTSVEATVYAASEVNTPPRPVERVAPTYPEHDEARHVEGTVFVTVTVDGEGKVTHAEVTERSTEESVVFDEAALEAARAWTFEPATYEGEPVVCKIVIPFAFKHT